MGRLTGMGARLVSAPPRLRAAPKTVESFYASREWRQLVATIKRKRGNWCEDCGAGGPGVRVIGDHIVERKDGGAELDEANIRLRCASCHNRKTAKERAARAAGDRMGGGRKSG